MSHTWLGTANIQTWPGTDELLLTVPGEWHEHLTLIHKNRRDQIRIVCGNREALADVVFTDEREVQATDELRRTLLLPKGEISAKAVDGVLHFGPFIGLYAAPSARPERPFGGLTALFRDMMPLAEQLGLSLYVFTPGDAKWQEGWVNASVYNPRTKQWQKAKRPLPDLVLPKILGTPPAWREEVLHDTEQFQRRVPCGTFNNATGNKWTVHEQLHANADLRRWLPETERITSPGVVDAMLARRGSVYIKPAIGTQGMRIYRLDTQDGKVLVQHRSKSKTVHRKFAPESRELHAFVKKNFLARRTFLVQQTLPLLTLRGGRPVDFRWLVQKDGSNEWCVTARVARVGAANRLTTNLHTGGSAVLAETLLQKNGWGDATARRRLLEELDEAAFAICRTLERHAGRIGELGLDFGLTRQGNVYLIEVNPRPGRQMLLDTSPDLRRLSLLRNLEYAKSTTGYQP
ncbi:YheC/YheD family protein [Tumebacillus flagellatus]|uniref:ATP-grasp domain-containing protein n=1 Tax=Tumebacillus flagellatus TaxID=1157490 RepID=A0A074LW05_9BACL|nr:YheC/YheD family protein [Tumebacillus flagellatus]KEO84223.1 hypothetical protein EL26_05510 [Tumebacillus flagellatus]